MSEAILALRAAIHARLAADGPLTALIGSGRIYEQPPRAAKGVYIVHGETEARDWSTGDSGGCELDVSLAVWAAEPSSARAALDAGAAVVRALEGADLTLSGHRLVLLRWLSSRLARDRRSDLPFVTVRLRALTELL